MTTRHKPAHSEDGMPERFSTVEIGGPNHAAYARAFPLPQCQDHDQSQGQGNELVATLGSDYGEGGQDRRVDQIVVEHGTLPMANLYDELKPLSINRALLAGRPQEVVRNAAMHFRLFRVGEAVASRNMHTAIFDALRLAKDV